MSLSSILNASMTAVQMKELAGKTRSKGAKRKDELIFGVLLAMGVRRDAALEQLPKNLQTKIKGSPAALAELQRIELASPECANWADMRDVLEYFPPSVLLTILFDEMTATQMSNLAGSQRSEGAKLKIELVFGVLLAMAERGASAMRDLPANARRRIEAAPAALEWTEMVRTRAEKKVLEGVSGWRGFREKLCLPPNAVDDDDDDVEEEEDDYEIDDAAAESPADPATTESKGSKMAKVAGKLEPSRLQAKLDAAASEDDSSTAPLVSAKASRKPQVAVWCSEHSWLCMPAVLVLNASAAFGSNGGVAGYLVASGVVMLLALGDLVAL